MHDDSTFTHIKAGLEDIKQKLQDARKALAIALGEDKNQDDRSDIRRCIAHIESCLGILRWSQDNLSVPAARRVRINK